MTPQQLYDTIKQAFPKSEVASICYTSRDCLRNGFCSNQQAGKVIDFDSVKEVAYKGVTPTPASVDAVCVSSEDDPAFVFVELKGWKQYIDKIYYQKQTPQEKASGYNLAGKLSDSQHLCMKLAGDKDLFLHIPVRFLLVTDINTEYNGIDAFHSMLNQLADTSSHLYSECLSEARKCLESEIYIDRDYISCKDFDRYLCSSGTGK